MPTPPRPPKSNFTPPRPDHAAATRVVIYASVIYASFVWITFIVVGNVASVALAVAVAGALALAGAGAGVSAYLRGLGGRTRSGLTSGIGALVGRAARYWEGDPDVWAGRAMRVAARLMPQAVGERWLGEAESFLFEVAPVQRAKVTRNYLVNAPRVIAAGWVGELARHARRPVGGRAGARTRQS